MNLNLREPLIKIYKSSYKLKDIEPLPTEEYYVFSRSKIPFRVFILNGDNLELLMKMEGYESFFERQTYFYISPITYEESLLGFIIRIPETDNKLNRYRIFYFTENPLLFGLGNFTSYKNNQPIIFTEGCKDAIAIQLVYKYTLAFNSSGINSNYFRMFTQITKNMVFAFDKDKAGKDSAKRYRILCEKFGIKCSFIFPKTYKDFGEELFKNKEEIFNILYKDKINLLTGVTQNG